MSDLILPISHLEAVNNPQLYAEYKELCFDLHLPCPLVTWTFKIKHKDNVIIRKEPAASWTRNFWNWMAMSQLSINCNHASNFGAGYLTWKTIAGNVRGSTTDTLQVYYNAYSSGTVYPRFDTQGGKGYRSDAAANYGILIGTGNTAFDIEQYSLVTPIANGTGSGQMSYQGMDAGTGSWTSGTLTYNFNWFRYFNNNSGGAITVNEVGLAANTEVSDYYVLFERHVIGGGLEVDDTAQLKCEYDISLVYPS